MYNANIQTFWHKKKCIKTWCNSKSLWIMSIFLGWFFGPKMVRFFRSKMYQLYNTYSPLLPNIKEIIVKHWLMHIVPLTMRHHLFLEFWLVDTWFFCWRHYRSITRLKNEPQSNIRRGKKLGVQLSHKNSPCSVSTTALKKLSAKNKQVIVHKLPFEKIFIGLITLKNNNKYRLQYI